VLGQREGDRSLLQRAEVRLAVLDEDVGDGGARADLDVAVGIAETGAQPFGQRRPDGGLPGRRRPDEDDERPAHRICSASR
jgi:hypothetical protein